MIILYLIRICSIRNLRSILSEYRIGDRVIDRSLAGMQARGHATERGRQWCGMWYKSRHVYQSPTCSSRSLALCQQSWLCDRSRHSFLPEKTFLRQCFLSCSGGKKWASPRCHRPCPLSVTLVSAFLATLNIRQDRRRAGRPPHVSSRPFILLLTVVRMRSRTRSSYASLAMYAAIVPPSLLPSFFRPSSVPSRA